MDEQIKELKGLLNAMVRQLVVNYPLDIPKWRFDGEEVSTPDEVAVILGIPVTEAKARMGFKDIYMGEGSGVPLRHSTSALCQRAHRLVHRRTKKRKVKKQ